MSQPTWLQSCHPVTHRVLVFHTLAAREALRESARAARSDPVTNTNPRSHSSHAPDIPSNIKDYYSCSVAQLACNRLMNRYRLIEPYDRTRVIVPTPPSPQRTRGAAGAAGGPGETVTDAQDQARYINANWVREAAGGKWWIAGQAPLPHTAHAFLTLALCPGAPPPAATSIFSSISPPPLPPVCTIVQLTLPEEGGRRKAHSYFPTIPFQGLYINPEPGCNAPSLHVRLLDRVVIDDAKCIKSELTVGWSEDRTSRVITHLLYTDWPDFGVPVNPRSMINFARLVERENSQSLRNPTGDPNETSPVLVHCSAGIGRTGTFIALCSLLRAHSLLSDGRPPSASACLTPILAPPLPMSPLGPLPKKLATDLVANEIDSLREQRLSMAEKNEQVAWVYTALVNAFDEL